MTLIKSAIAVFALVFVSACVQPMEEEMMEEEMMESGDAMMSSDGGKAKSSS